MNTYYFNYNKIFCSDTEHVECRHCWEKLRSVQIQLNNYFRTNNMDHNNKNSKYYLSILWASLVVLVVKKPACQCRRHKRYCLVPWVRKIP